MGVQVEVIKAKKKIERSPLESKKFLAAMTWSLGWLALIGYGIKAGLDADVLSAMVYANGAVQMLYLGGQAAVDGFVRKALAQVPAASPPLIQRDAITLDQEVHAP